MPGPFPPPMPDSLDNRHAHMVWQTTGRPCMAIPCHHGQDLLYYLQLWNCTQAYKHRVTQRAQQLSSELEPRSLGANARCHGHPPPHQALSGRAVCGHEQPLPLRRHYVEGLVARELALVRRHQPGAAAAPARRDGAHGARKGAVRGRVAHAVRQQLREADEVEHARRAAGATTCTHAHAGVRPRARQSGACGRDWHPCHPHNAWRQRRTCSMPQRESSWSMPPQPSGQRLYLAGPMHACMHACTYALTGRASRAPPAQRR